MQHLSTDLIIFQSRFSFNFKDTQYIRHSIHFREKKKMKHSSTFLCKFENRQQRDHQESVIHSLNMTTSQRRVITSLCFIDSVNKQRPHSINFPQRTSNIFTAFSFNTTNRQVTHSNYKLLSNRTFSVTSRSLLQH